MQGQRMPLWAQIVIGLILGIVAGWVLRFDALAGVRPPIIEFFDAGATIFLRLLKMLVVPLVVSSLFMGITNISSMQGLGRLGTKTGIYYICSSLFAIAVGMTFVNIIKPGVGASLSLGEFNVNKFMKASTDPVDLITRIVPTNPLESMAASPPDMLGLIFFTLMFAVFALQVDKKHLKTISGFMEAVFEVMVKIVDFVIRLAPVAVLFLMGKLVAESDPKIFGDLLWYLATVTGALLFHFFVVLPLAYFIFTKKNPYVFLGHMSSAILTAFSSASSAATLPLTMECIEYNAKIPNKVASMVLPLGATVNMDGTALYEGVAVIFIAQVLGVDLSFFQQLTIFGTALMVSIGAAGIPHAGLVMMVIILEAVNLPSEAIGIIFAVDRVVDMTRTAVNVWSDSIGAAIVAEGES